MVAPTLDVPLYPYLARLDPDRFLPGRRRDPRRLGHGAQDQPAVRRVAARRGQPRAQPRAALARVPDRPARHPVPPVLGPRQRRRHRPDPHLAGEQRPRRATARATPTARSPCSIRGELLRRYPNASLYAWRSVDGVARREPAGARGPAHPGVRRRARGGHHLRRVRPERGRAAQRRRLVLRHPGAGDRAAVRVRRARRARPAAALDSWSEATWEHTGTAPGALPAHRRQPARRGRPSTACGSSTTPPTSPRSPTSSRCGSPSTPAAFPSWWPVSPTPAELRGPRRRPRRRRPDRAAAGPARGAVRRRRAAGPDLPGPDPPGQPRAGADRPTSGRRRGVLARAVRHPRPRRRARRRPGRRCAAASSRRVRRGSSRR